MAKFERNRNRLTTCRCCKKPTHSSIDGCLDVELCRVCLESAEMENGHSDNDGHPNNDINYDQNCPTCTGLGCMHEQASRFRLKAEAYGEEAAYWAKKGDAATAKRLAIVAAHCAHAVRR